MSDSRKYIYAYKGGEYRTFVSTIYKEEAFFYPAYQQAAHVITEIVLENEKFLARQKETKCLNQARAYMRGENTMNETSQILGYPNNIVAFCGHRGQGKTSAMLSMSKALELMPDLVNDSEYSGKVKAFWKSEPVRQGFMELTGGKENPVQKKRFVVLEPIDPTLMGKETSILRCIISKMYTLAFEEGKKRPSRYSSAAAYNQEHFGRPWQQPYDQNVNEEEQLQGDLTMDFLKCFHSLETMEETGDQTLNALSDDLTELAEKGDSFNLKQQFATLVRHFLNYMTRPNDECSRDAMLVVQVDDADLNTENAYRFAEEIRKYCILPRTIILMALHDESMLRNIEQHFVKQYADMLQNGRMKAEKCHEITGRYFDKLFPGRHQIHLPVISSVVRSDPASLKLRYLPQIPDEKQTEKKIDLLSFRYPLTAPRDTTLVADHSVSLLSDWDGGQRDPDELDYQERLIMLLYQKTGLILVKPNSHLHSFLPSNMRELTHMLAYLDSMPSVIKTQQEGSEEKEVTGNWLWLLRQCALQGDTENHPGVKSIRKQLDNLDAFEQYFIHIWCAGCLTRKQAEIINTIEKTPDEQKIRITIQLLEEYAEIYIETGSDDTLSFADVADALLLLTQGHGEEKLQCAVQMYYSIYLNRIALKGLNSWMEKGRPTFETAPFEWLAQFLGYRIFPDSYYGQKGKTAPFPYLFTIKGLTRENPDLVLRWNQWLAPVYAEEGELPSLAHWNEDVVLLEKTPDGGDVYIISSPSCCFDLFRPLAYQIGKFRYDGMIQLDTAASLLQLLCNVDLQYMLYQRYFKDPASDMVKKFDDFRRFTEGAYSEFDARINDSCVMNIRCNLSNITPDLGTDPNGLNELWALRAEEPTGSTNGAEESSDEPEKNLRKNWSDLMQTANAFLIKADGYLDQKMKPKSYNAFQKGVEDATVQKIKDLLMQYPHSDTTGTEKLETLEPQPQPQKDQAGHEDDTNPS